MKTVIHNKVAFECVPPEYREMKAAFAREALPWSLTIGGIAFSEEETAFCFDTWDRAEPLFDGSMEALSRLFPAVFFTYYQWEKPQQKDMALTKGEAWCAGEKQENKTAEELGKIRDRAYLACCRRFLHNERGVGEGCTHKAQLTEEEERGAVSWGENRFGECEVYYWDTLKDLDCGDFHTVATRTDGRSVACGSNANGQCDVELFRNADRLTCGRYHTAALKKVGSVLLASADERFTQYSTWRGIIGLRSVGDTLIGVKRDGCVVIDGDPMCPCSRDEIREMFPDLKLTFPPEFKSLAAKIAAEDKRKERAAENAAVKKFRRAPASAVELDDTGRIPDRAKKVRTLKFDDTPIKVTYSYAEMLKALEEEFCGDNKKGLPYYVTNAAKYTEQNGIAPSGDNCKRVSEEESRRQIREFLMTCRLCANKSFARELVENAAKTSTGKLVKSRSQRITTFRLTHGEDFYELYAKNADAETLEIGIAALECTIKNCRGLTTQPDSRAVLTQYCSVKLD